MFINFWYVAEESRNVTADRPVKVRMLGHHFALWRDSTGQVHCVANTCPHRAGSLGDGRLHGDGLECPYHGWTFNGGGSCVRIPSLGKDARIPDRARVDSYPVEERYGLVFVFLGDLPEAERPPIIDLPEWNNPEWYAQLFRTEWDIDYKRSMENTLDPAHNEFVHDTHGFSGRNEDYRVADITMEDTAWGSGFMIPMYSPRLPDQAMHEASKRADAQWSEAGSGYHGPNVTWTYIHLSAEARFHNITFHTPVHESRDRLFIFMFRAFMHDPKHDESFAKRFWYVADQDRDVLHAMEPVRTPRTNITELLMPADRPIASYRAACQAWERRGWRLDVARWAASRQETATAIPGPGRRERPRGWVIPSVPLLAPGQPLAAGAAEGQA